MKLLAPLILQAPAARGVRPGMLDVGNCRTHDATSRLSIRCFGSTRHRGKSILVRTPTRLLNVLDGASSAAQKCRVLSSVGMGIVPFIGDDAPIGAGATIQSPPPDRGCIRGCRLISTAIWDSAEHPRGSDKRRRTASSLSTLSERCCRARRQPSRSSAESAHRRADSNSRRTRDRVALCLPMTRSTDH